MFSVRVNQNGNHSNYQCDSSQNKRRDKNLTYRYEFRLSGCYSCYNKAQTNQSQHREKRDPEVGSQQATELVHYCEDRL